MVPGLPSSLVAQSFCQRRHRAGLFSQINKSRPAPVRSAGTDRCVLEAMR